MKSRRQGSLRDNRVRLRHEERVCLGKLGRNLRKDIQNVSGILHTFQPATTNEVSRDRSSSPRMSNEGAQRAGRPRTRVTMWHWYNGIINLCGYRVRQ